MDSEKNDANIMPNVFDKMGIYWAEIAYKNQTEKQIRFLKSHLKPEGYILDLACGTARHSIILSKLGYCMIGFDVSPNLLKIAKQSWRNVQLVRGDMRYLPFNAETFLSSISMDTSFGYLASEQDDRNSLNELQKTVKQNGTFIIDVFNREKLRLKYRFGKSNYFFTGVKWTALNFPIKLFCLNVLFRIFKWKEYESFFLLQKRVINQKANRLCDFWVIYDKAKKNIAIFEHSVHLFKPNELNSFLEDAGFTVTQAYGGYEGEKFSTNASRLILVSNRK